MLAPSCVPTPPTRIALRDSRHCSWRRRRMRAQRASFLPRATAECAKSSALRRLPTTLESYPAIIKSVAGRRTLPQPVLDLPVRKGRDRRSSLPYGVNRNCSSSENSAGTTWFRSVRRRAFRAPPPPRAQLWDKSHIPEASPVPPPSASPNGWGAALSRRMAEDGRNAAVFHSARVVAKADAAGFSRDEACALE